MDFTSNAMIHGTAINPFQGFAPGQNHAATRQSTVHNKLELSPQTNQVLFTNEDNEEKYPLVNNQHVIYGKASINNKLQGKIDHNDIPNLLKVRPPDPTSNY